MKAKKELNRLRMIETTKSFDNFYEIIAEIILAWGKAPKFKETFSIEQASDIAAGLLQCLNTTYRKAPGQRTTAEGKRNRFSFWLSFDPQTSMLTTVLADDIDEVAYDFNAGLVVRFN